MSVDGASIDWTSLATTLAKDPRPLVHGARMDVAGPGYELTAPRDGSVLCSVPEPSARDVQHAVECARAEQQVGCWPGFTPRVRGEILKDWADGIEAQRVELALLVSLETGKPVREALEVDLQSVVKALRWHGALADKLHGDHPDVGSRDLALVSREAVGVVGILLPSNFPLSLIGYDVAPALMLGNSVVIKPSEQAPLSVLRVCEIAVEAGVSRDAISVLPGLSSTVGQAIARHGDIDAISVTGSVAAGRAVMAASAESNGKRVWPELGGKSAALIFQDAGDIGAAAAALAWGSFLNQGEMCTGCSRVLVEAPVHDEFVDAFSREIDKLRLGDPLDWATTVGALTTRRQRELAEDAVARTVDGGGSIVRGGEVRDVVEGGHYFPPTLLTEAAPDSPVFTDEVFSPIVAVRSFDDVDDAQATIHASGYGMGLSVWTSSLDRAFQVTRRAKVGIAWVNCFEGDDMTVPAGGVGRSGYGRTKGLAVLDKYSDIKTTWVHLDS
ncbi:aldehyde dehydrogenase family protein [Nocardioides sp. LML1-1-1.1]|uniref:aldehyde dehydrogenase family protein n=1 Tax=Nocardioides sp. LML1-1-1.1 TaxID=3135248 RepID=UPI003446C8A5